MTVLPLRRSSVRMAASERQDAVARVHDEDEHVRFGDRRAHLHGRKTFDAFVAAGQATRIHDHEGSRTEATDTVVPVAGDAGHIGDEGVPATRQRIEEGRLTDIGAADQGDDG